MRLPIRKDVFLTVWWQLPRKWPVTISKEGAYMVVTIDDDRVKYTLCSRGREHTVVSYKGRTMVVKQIHDGYTIEV
jgi:hypothetical protein